MAILVLPQGLAHEYPFAAARDDREHAGDSRTCRRPPSPSAVSPPPCYRSSTKIPTTRAPNQRSGKPVEVLCHWQWQENLKSPDTRRAPCCDRQPPDLAAASKVGVATIRRVEVVD